MSQNLKELPEQSEMLCGGLGWVTLVSWSSLPFRLLRSILALRDNVDVNFGSSVALKLSLYVRLCRVCSGRRVVFFSLTAAFTHTMSISGEPSLTFLDHRKI